MNIIQQKYGVIIVSALIIMGGFFAVGAEAQVVLQIRDLKVTTTDETATISWTTNFASGARIDFGPDQAYGYYLVSGERPNITHSFTIGNLTSEKTYHFKIFSDGGGQTVSTFDRTFKTTKGTNNHDGPTMTNVKVIYVTGSAATIQWETDEPSSSQLKYGETATYGRGASGKSNVTLHEVTLRGLKIGALYHFQAYSVDKDKNTATWHDQTFSTLLNGEADKVPLELSNITPLTTNDAKLSADSAEIGWRSNKPGTGVVRYGTTTRPNKSVTIAGLSDFEHSTLLTALTADTTYYFTVESKDVFGKLVKSDLLSFKTRARAAIVPQVAVSTGDNPRVLGFSTLDVTRPTALYRAVGSKDVYAILKGQRYRLINIEALRRYGYTRLPVKDVSQATLDQYPLVRLVKASNSQTVYYLSRRADNKTLKIAIPSPSVFASYPRNKWDKIVALDPAEVALYENAKLLKAASSDTVYLLEGNQKRQISQNQILQRGFKLTDVVEVSALHLQGIATGTSL